MKKQIFKYKGIEYIIIDTDKSKICRSSDSSYNFQFNKLNGDFYRWGKTFKNVDDPLYSPLGPEILDLEVSVNGCSSFCDYCYKSNTNNPANNMSFETFKIILDKMPLVLTQIAFGITDETTNPDLIRMMEYCRKIGVIPNITITGKKLTDELVVEFSKNLGAIAVSVHPQNKELCYQTIYKLTQIGCRQVNMHIVVSEENLSFVYEIIKDIRTQKKLNDLNAIVFLGIKPKGRARKNFSSVSQIHFNDIVNYCNRNNIAYGFDSCSAPKFAKSFLDSNMPKKSKNNLLSMTESCESSLFSAYIDVNGFYWPCSFAEGEREIVPIDVKKANNFTIDVWNNALNLKFRSELIKSTERSIRKCIIFNSIN